MIESVEGPLALVECMLDDASCSLTSTCCVRTPLTRVHEQVLATLASLTLAQIVADADLPGPRSTGPELPVLQ